MKTTNIGLLLAISTMHSNHMIKFEDKFKDGKQNKPNYQRFNQRRLRKKKW